VELFDESRNHAATALTAEAMDLGRFIKPVELELI
jgi:hypothetical protein